MNVNRNLGEGCLEKQRTLDRLKQENQSLRERVRRRERKAEQGPSGSSTPSAKIPVKANTAEEQRSKPGGAKPVQARPPEVLPKSLYGNQRVTQVVLLHFRPGIPMGRLCDQLGVGLGAVFEIRRRMAALFPVRQADETGRRTDGRSGYAWLLASATVSLFLFRTTRSAQVPKEVLGEQALGGVLVVDRYNAYNRAPCALQYCYAHLLRDVEDLAKEFPGETEVTAFTSTLIPLLAGAMHLRGRPLSDAEYYD